MRSHSSKRSSHHSSRTQGGVREFTVAIKCRHCALKYVANPVSAICPKCKCPANRSLDQKTLVIYGLVPPLSLFRSWTLRQHSPLASFQALASAGIGLTVYLAIYFIIVAVAGRN